MDSDNMNTMLLFCVAVRAGLRGGGKPGNFLGPHILGGP